MRKVIGGWVLTVVGVLIALLGAAVMIVLGPDGRITTGPHPIDTDVAAVVTSPGIVKYAGVQVDVLVEVPIDKPIFVGVGHTVDVHDYVGGTRRLEITSYETPWTVATTEVEGEPNLPSAPTALDWWIASQAGLGGADITFALPDEPVSIAVVAVGSTNLTGLEVTVAYGVKGGFGRASGLVILGAGIAWFGWLLRSDRLWQQERPSAWRRRRLLGSGRAGSETAEEVEEIFVWIDEDGVEHEISPDELADFEIVDEEPEPASDAEPEPEPEAESDPEPVVYVVVDEFGVEHEVPEDELGDYEIVEDDDDEAPKEDRP